MTFLLVESAPDLLLFENGQQGDLKDYSAKTQSEIHKLEQASLAECA